ncbi:hypothetical protein [Streptomyces alfalfae]|uniref:hypothetical protein n=1 Tax=Streptomyces alfalfae TaxID=1642299 RepID=UPI002811F340|nr:hypothetical protein [Streptomyces alfalfae]
MPQRMADPPDKTLTQPSGLGIDHTAPLAGACNSRHTVLLVGHCPRTHDDPTR